MNKWGSVGNPRRTPGEWINDYRWHAIQTRQCEYQSITCRVNTHDCLMTNGGMSHSPANCVLWLCRSWRFPSPSWVARVSDLVSRAVLAAVRLPAFWRETRATQPSPWFRSQPTTTHPCIHMTSIVMSWLPSLSGRSVRIMHVSMSDCLCVCPDAKLIFF